MTILRPVKELKTRFHYRLSDRRPCDPVRAPGLQADRCRSGLHAPPDTEVGNGNPSKRCTGRGASPRRITRSRLTVGSGTGMLESVPYHTAESQVHVVTLGTICIKIPRE